MAKRELAVLQNEAGSEEVDARKRRRLASEDTASNRRARSIRQEATRTSRLRSLLNKFKEESFVAASSIELVDPQLNPLGVI